MDCLGHVVVPPVFFLSQLLFNTTIIIIINFNKSEETFSQLFKISVINTMVIFHAHVLHKVEKVTLTYTVH